MSNPGVTYTELKKAGLLLPQEEMLEIARKGVSLSIGIPKETSFQENRVPLVPSAVALLTARGHRVMIESDAGKAANFQDRDYAEVGARIVYSKEEVYQAEMILKVSPPTSEELSLMKPRQVLFSAVQLTTRYGDVIRELLKKKSIAIAYNYLRADDGVYPVVRSMGEIAGSTAILIAAEYLSNVNAGKGLMLGGVTGIPPVEVVIIGAGIVAEHATRTALGLGADVKVFDISLSRLARLQHSLGNYRIYTALIEQSELAKRIASADVVVGALRAPEGRTPCVVTEEMVSEMKYGSVIVDVSIDQGGCFETSAPTNHNDPVFKKYGVIHYCVPNIASRVAHTASIALSNIFGPILAEIGDSGGLDKYMHAHPMSRNGVYTYQGMLTNKFFSDMYGIPYTDIDLLMAAF